MGISFKHEKKNITGPHLVGEGRGTLTGQEKKGGHHVAATNSRRLAAA